MKNNINQKFINIFQENIENFIKEFEQEYNSKIIYITHVGSKLFGMEDEQSDKDIAFIFIPDSRDIILGKNIDNIKFNSNNYGKNSSNDIDISGISIKSFLNGIESGISTHYDLYFSLFRNDTIIYENRVYCNIFRNYKKDLITNINSRSYMGYYKNQEKKFFKRNKEYRELLELKKYIDKNIIKYIRLNDLIKHSNIKQFIKNMKYVSIDEHFLYVINKSFDVNIKLTKLISNIDKMLNSFSNRIKNGYVDYKALSHAYRILYEFEQLLVNKFIKFPLNNSKELLDIKRGRCDYEKTVKYLLKYEQELLKLYNYYKITSYNNSEFINSMIVNFILKEEDEILSIYSK